MTRAVPAGYDAADVQRFAQEPDKDARRSPFARDRARVLHSAALRRLAAKTQVVAAGQSDIPRTRLTHTLEVAQVAREMGAHLGCDPDLVETAGLAHDLGHPPFGHNGEVALHDIAAACGGFEGNAQSFRVLTRLEAKTMLGGRSAGVNLTRAALDAATKYPWPADAGSDKFGVYDDDREVFDWMRRGAARAAGPGGVSGEPTGLAPLCLEAQVMDWADDVAYSVHDVEDAVQLGHLDVALLTSAHERAELIGTAQRWFAPAASGDELAEALARLTDLPMWPRSYAGTMRDLAGLKSLTSTLIARFSTAAQDATRQRYGTARLRRYDAALVVPAEARAEVVVMKTIAVRYVMQRPGAERTYAEQRQILTELVAALVLRGGRGLEPWLREVWDAAPDDAARLRVTVDQVASLTDVSAVHWHRRYCR